MLHPLSRLALASALALPALLGAQEWGVRVSVRERADRAAMLGDSLRERSAESHPGALPAPTSEWGANFGRRFLDRRDSLDWENARRSAERSSGFRLIVSLQDRYLWVVSDADTLLSAPVGVASGRTLEHEGRTWRFRTPRGARVVRSKETDPIWRPPDWHYAEAALEHDLALAKIPNDRPYPLPDGRTLSVRDSLVGVMGADSVFLPLRIDEHIVFGDTLYVPPLGTLNRQIKGELGRFRLDLGEGYLLHGTPDEGSVGRATTHGCLRLRDSDIEWLFEYVPIGTRVYIY